MELRALFGALSSQAGAFSPLNGPDARALSAAPGVVQPLMYLADPFMGNLGAFFPRGVNDAPLVGPGSYAGNVPSDLLVPVLSRPEPWETPGSSLR